MKKAFFLLGFCLLTLLLSGTSVSAGVIRIITSCRTEVLTISELHKDMDDLIDTLAAIEEIECGTKTHR